METREVWKWSFLIAVRAISKPLYEGLKKIEDNINQDFRKSRLSIEELKLSDQADTLSVLLCKDEVHVGSAELLEPTFTSPDPRINARLWNKNAEVYATRTGERASDGIRRAVDMNKIAPQDMRQHFMLNQSRLSTAEEVAQEI